MYVSPARVLVGANASALSGRVKPVAGGEEVQSKMIMRVKA